MKIVSTEPLSIPGVFVLRFARFSDERGYFTETFRRSEFDELPFLNGVRFVQCNESFSRPGVARGLHFQWNPHMGKLVRTVHGRMLDVVVDIRLGSPTFGQALIVDMPARQDDDSNTWIWVPPGFAHGNGFTEETTIEYFCSGEYSPGCEACISFAAPDIDWSLCDPDLKSTLDGILRDGLITEKDAAGLSLAQWRENESSGEFRFGEC